MTSRERVWKAINFEEADRIPIDIGATKVTGICIDAYVDLVNYLGIDLGLPKIYEQFGMLARVEEPVRRRLHSDVIELENPSEAWRLENKNWKPWKTGLGNDVLMPGNFNPITDWLCILVNDKKYAYSILQATAERAVENLNIYLQAVGDYIDTIFISGTDFGTQKGELFNPEIFPELYVPNIKPMND
ncbi:MAG: hypothetical protein QG588_1627 [Candidatus Poribacteria bacterium]|nr:hypothetical protein [Candidatus Poribacteria bacterium]